MNDIQQLDNKRKEFRKSYTGVFFNSYLNIALVIIVFTTSLIFSGMRINWDFGALLLFPVALLYAELALYAAHRYQQHNKIRFQQRIFEMHTIWHHGMFSDEKIHVESLKDMNMVILPFFVHGFVLGLIYLPLGFLISILFKTDAGWIFMFAITLHLVWYEFVHTLSHLKYPPFFTRLAKHHKEHHNPKLMGKYNFGVTTTFFDRLFGTKYSST